MDRDVVRDLRHMMAAWDASAMGVVRASLPKLLLQPRFRAIVLLRASQTAYRRPWCRWLSYWLSGRVLRGCGAEIHPAARLGPGFALVHSSGIVIGHEVRAGCDLALHQGVTLGHGSGARGQPTLGDRVRIGANAVLLGPILIGDDARIGAGALVLADVPPKTTVTGVWKGPAG